jgi:hypothetical protein
MARLDRFRRCAPRSIGTASCSVRNTLRISSRLGARGCRVRQRGCQPIMGVSPSLRGSVRHMACAAGNVVACPETEPQPDEWQMCNEPLRCPADVPTCHGQGIARPAYRFFSLTRWTNRRRSERSPFFCNWSEGPAVSDSIKLTTLNETGAVNMRCFGCDCRNRRTHYRSAFCASLCHLVIDSVSQRSLCEAGLQFHKTGPGLPGPNGCYTRSAAHTAGRRSCTRRFSAAPDGPQRSCDHSFYMGGLSQAIFEPKNSPAAHMNIMWRCVRLWKSNCLNIGRRRKTRFGSVIRTRLNFTTSSGPPLNFCENPNCTVEADQPEHRVCCWGVVMLCWIGCSRQLLPLPKLCQLYNKTRVQHLSDLISRHPVPHCIMCLCAIHTSLKTLHGRGGTLP